MKVLSISFTTLAVACPVRQDTHVYTLRQEVRGTRPTPHRPRFPCLCGPLFRSGADFSKWRHATPSLLSEGCQGVDLRPPGRTHGNAEGHKWRLGRAWCPTLLLTKKQRQGDSFSYRRETGVPDTLGHVAFPRVVVDVCVTSPTYLETYLRLRDRRGSPTRYPRTGGTLGLVSRQGTSSGGVRGVLPARVCLDENGLSFS